MRTCRPHLIPPQREKRRLKTLPRVRPLRPDLWTPRVGVDGLSELVTTLLADLVVMLNLVNLVGWLVSWKWVGGDMGGLVGGSVVGGGGVGRVCGGGSRRSGRDLPPGIFLLVTVTGPSSLH